MRFYGYDIFEEMDMLIDEFFTQMDNVIIYVEPDEDEDEEPIDI